MTSKYKCTSDKCTLDKSGNYTNEEACNLACNKATKSAADFQKDYQAWYCSGFPDASGKVTAVYAPYNFVNNPYGPCNDKDGNVVPNCKFGNGQGQEDKDKTKLTKITTAADCADTEKNPNYPNFASTQSVGDIKDINTFLQDQRSTTTGCTTPYSSCTYQDPKWAKACCWNTSVLDPDIQQSLCANQTVKFGHSGKFDPRRECDVLMDRVCAPMATYDVNKDQAVLGGKTTSLKIPTIKIPQGQSFEVIGSGPFLGHKIEQKPGYLLTSQKEIPIQSTQVTFDGYWKYGMGPPTDPNDYGLCGCYNLDDDVTSKDAQLYKQLLLSNSGLEAQCVINKCANPRAYKNSKNRGSCPNVCSAIAPEDKTSDYYVGVTCSPNDIMVNEIDSTISGKGQNAKGVPTKSSSGDNTKPFYRSITFYILLVIVVVLVVLLVVKLVRRR